MRRAARVDGNQAAIIAAARQLGFRVLDLSKVGNGCPDLLLYSPRTRRLALVEVKMPKGRLRALQERFMQEWPVAVVRTLDDLMKLPR